MNLDSIASEFESAVKLSRLSGVNYTEMNHEPLGWRIVRGSTSLDPETPRSVAADLVEEHGDPELGGYLRHYHSGTDLHSLFKDAPFAATQGDHPHRRLLIEAATAAGHHGTADALRSSQPRVRAYYHGDGRWTVEAAPKHSHNRLGRAVHSYLNTALWSSTGENGLPLDNDYDTHAFHPSAFDRANHDWQRFRASLSPEALEEIDNDEGQAGHDFWLTRNGHGSGFWDGDWEYGDELTDAAHRFGEQDVDEGDGSVLHLHGGK